MKHLKTFAALCCMAALFAACEKNNVGSVTGTENGHDYVDLGLSVKWATCNVGATKPEEYGSYYAWGETEPKTTYDWSTYKWCNGSWNNFTKYNTRSSFGTVDNQTVLELADDAAAVNWGVAWRIPTDGEWGELLDECTWEWKNAYKGTTAGYLVTSKTNGNSIFLPAAGYRINGGLSLAGNDGYYWSSSLNPDYPSDPRCAWYVSFDSGSVFRGNSSRCCGQSVRAVMK